MKTDQISIALGKVVAAKSAIRKAISGLDDFVHHPYKETAFIRIQEGLFWLECYQDKLQSTLEHLIQTEEARKPAPTITKITPGENNEKIQNN